MLRILLSSILVSTTSSLAYAAPDVVASIKPVHSIIATIMKDVGEPTLLVDGNVSPHDYTMKPSDAKAVQDADMVVWIGEGMETFLIKPIETLVDKANVIELMDIEGINKIENAGHDEHEKKEEHSDHDHSDAHNHSEEASHSEHSHAGHDHGKYNPHIWLDVENMQLAAAKIAYQLATIDPDNANKYESNLAEFKSGLAEVDGKIKKELTAVQGKNFMTWHPAFTYFEEHHALGNVGSVASNDHSAPGAGKIKELQHEMKHENVQCIFTEPTVNLNIINTIIEGTDVKIGEIDPIGFDLEAGPDQYFALLQKVSAGFTSCLASGS